MSLPRRSSIALVLALSLSGVGSLAQSRGPAVPSLSTEQKPLAAAALPDESLDLVGPTEKQKARAEAAAKAKAEADGKAKLEAEAKVKAEAEAKLKAESDAKAKAAAELQAKAEADAKSKLEAEAKLKAEAEAKAKLELEAKLKAEAEAKAKFEAEAKAKAEELSRLKLEAEVKAKAEAEAKARLEAEAQAKLAAEAKAKADLEASAKAARLEAESKARLAAESQQRAEAEAKVAADAKAAQKAAADAAPARRVLTPGAAPSTLPAPAALVAAPAAATSPAAAAPAAPVAAATPAVPADPNGRAEVEARVRAQVEAQVKAEVEARVRAEVDRQIALQKSAAASKDLSLADAKADCKPDKKAKKKKGAKAAALPAHCVTDLALGDTTPAPAPAPAPIAPAPAPVRADEAATAALAERRPVLVAEAPRQDPAVSPDRATAAAPVAAPAPAPAPLADRAPGVRVAAASPVAMPAFDARSGRPTASSGPAEVLVPRDEGGGRRSRRLRVGDDLLVGPQGLMVNTLRASAEIVPESVNASFAYRALIDDASALHHGFFVTAEGAPCEATGPCGLRFFATGGFSPYADNLYGVQRKVAGQYRSMADNLGWSSFSVAAGGQGRSASGAGLLVDAQVQSVSLSYRRNANLPTSPRTDVSLQQLRLKASGSLQRGAFEARLTLGGSTYLADLPEKTTGMPLRGVLLDPDFGGLASGPQGLQAKLEGRYEFAFGLSAALSYGYLSYAGSDWTGAHLFGAMLQQRLGRFDVGLGLTVQLDAPSTLPAGASNADYSATYLSGRVAATF